MCRSYGFRSTWTRDGANREVLLESGTVRFLISQRSGEKPKIEEEGTYPWINCKCRDESTHSVDSVFNVCLEVGDVDKVCRNMNSHGATILSPPRTIVSRDGEIRVAVVTSPCENVVHSLVNTSSYSGHFLPGFRSTGSAVPGTEPEDVSMDHVTYVCRIGESQNILSWYKDCCGMERFMVNSDDDPEDGIVIRDEAGMRMMVGEWMSEWMCREEGVEWIGDRSVGASQDKRNFKLVLAEPLPHHDHSHVNSFIREHGGPGLQHIGLLTPDIVSKVTCLTERGARFRSPPPTYYSLPNKQEEIRQVGADPEIFRTLGILIDKEPGCESEGGKHLYILQIFTHPIFSRDTFFLEQIQRHGSRGFGAGNIRALAQSIIELARQKQVQEESSRMAVPEKTKISETTVGSRFGSEKTEISETLASEERSLL